MTFLSAATKNQQWKRVDFPQAHVRVARAMWMEGSNTKQISLALRCSEATIWNNMDRIRERRG